MYLTVKKEEAIDTVEEARRRKKKQFKESRKRKHESTPFPRCLEMREDIY
jgi:hypothetical protein